MVHPLNIPCTLPVNLLEGLSIHGMALSVLAGIRPGAVLTDDPDTPGAIFVAAPEGTFAWLYLAGDPTSPAFLSAIRQWVFDESGLGDDVGFAFLACDSEAWREHVPSLIEPRLMIPDRRLHYICTNPPSHPRTCADEYTIQPLDRELLASKIQIPQAISRWLDANFGSQEGFLDHGFGAVAIHQGAAVAWCLTDSVGKTSCDIGVETEDPHRKRGLASALTSMVLNDAFSRGLQQVGWHCHAINIPSVRTAERAGFSLAREYELYPIHFDVEKHRRLVSVVAAEFAEDARAALDRGDAASANQLCTDALAFVAEDDAELLVLAARAAAACGEADRALGHVKRAVASGWTAPQPGEGPAEFGGLMQDPRWQQLIMSERSTVD